MQDPEDEWRVLIRHSDMSKIAAGLSCSMILERYMIDYVQREFPMSEANTNLYRVAFKITGIVLGDHKKDLLYSRVSRRIRALGLDDFEQYIAVLFQPQSSELTAFVNCITTNLTAFFREAHHFDYLRQHFFPTIKQQGRFPSIWSAGCSSGEEAYSIVIALDQFFRQQLAQCKVLATDLDSDILQKARDGIYPLQRIDALSSTEKKHYFLKNNQQVRSKRND